MCRKIHILCATDENYASQCGIMLTSVFTNNPDSDAFVLVNGSLSPKSKARLESLQHRFNTKIYLIDIADEMFESMPKGGWHLSIVTYYRLCAAQILPKDIERCLYLDCDMIVDDDLSELWNTDLTDRSVAVVSDVWTTRSDIYDRLGYPQSKKYFNAGMLLINLDYWRRHNLQDAFFNYIENNREVIQAHDQDVLNVVLADSKVHVPIKWNFEIVGYARHFYDTFPRNVQDEINSLQPVIIHYAGPTIRPWMLEYYTYPFAKKWMEYKRMSPWKFQIYWFKTNRHLLRKLIKRFILWPLGYKKTTECEFVEIK